MKAITQIGSTNPSSDILDYASGKVKVAGKWRPFYRPLSNLAVVIAPNVPPAIRGQVLKDMPFALPVVCGVKLGQQERLVFKLDGCDFATYDVLMLEELAQASSLAAALVDAFISDFRKKPRRREEWLEARKKYWPVTFNGRFRSEVKTPEVLLLSAGLAFFEGFLKFAAAKGKWISDEESEEILLSFWEKILPESCPRKKVEANIAGQLQDPDHFLAFLQAYCEANLARIAQADEPWTPETLGMVKPLPKRGDDLTLIFPREQIFAAYVDWVKAQGGDVSLVTKEREKWQTKLQRALAEKLGFIKTGGRDTTWKHSFFPKSLSAKPTECIGITLAQLPSPLITPDSVFGRWLGIAEGPDQSTQLPNQELFLFDDEDDEF